MFRWAVLSRVWVLHNSQGKWKHSDSLLHFKNTTIIKHWEWLFCPKQNSNPLVDSTFYTINVSPDWCELNKPAGVSGCERHSLRSTTLSWISAAVHLVVSRFSTSSVSPRKFPEAEDRRDSRLSSSIFRVILKPFCCFVSSDYTKKTTTTTHIYESRMRATPINL